MLLFFVIMLSTVNLCAKKAELINIQKIDPSIQVDLVFETGDQPITEIPVIMYPKGTPAYICKEAAHALIAVQKELQGYGYSLKIRDAYRPLWAQKILWQEVLKLNLPNPEDYISDPVVEGGRHTRGTAVDLSIINISIHQEIPLPPFCFGELAHRDYYGPGLSEIQIKNRDFLRSLMVKHGFSTIRSEWWHFDYQGWQEYEPLNISFEELA